MKADLTGRNPRGRPFLFAQKELNRMKTLKNPSEFATKDIYLSSILRQAGVPLLRVEENGRQGIFVFKASPIIDTLIARYFNGELRVDPKSLFETWKALKSMAYSVIQDIR